jgi:AraC-like DNA-binding protein
LLAELLLCVVDDCARMSSIKINVRRYIQKALDYMPWHLGNDLRISEIAQDVNIASAYLQRNLQANDGRNAVHYINHAAY